MTWTQTTNPLHSIALSALAAAVPIFFIFWALAIKKMKGYKASLLTVLISVILAMILYGMPAKLAVLSAVHGAMYGFFPICWIIIGAVFLFNISVKSGQFEVIKNFMASITPDRRLQALLIAFSFGAFLEGATGFGAPVAITAAMLVGLGFDPLYAAGICLIANTAPVAFGAIGTPIIIASQVTDISQMTISQMVGRTLPILSLIVPFYLVTLMAGFKKMTEVLPAILVSGLTFAFFQWSTSNFLGPMLPDVLAGLASIIFLIIFLKYWKPKTVWHFKHEPPPTIDNVLRHSGGEIFKAWSPFIIMTIIVIAWGLAPVKAALNSVTDIKFAIPGLSGMLKPDGTPLVIKPFEFNYLSNPGSSVILAAFISLPLIGISFKNGFKIFMETLDQLKFPIITIGSVVGFAFVLNNSGMSNTMAAAIASTGVLFPFFSPVLGWLGVFLTGSDTSSNALFCKLQYTTGHAIGVDPLVTVAANASGGVTGKMISPQSIAVGAAAVGLVGREAELFRFTAKHSFIMLLAVCVITILQAYFITWIIPVYKMMGTTAAAAAPDLSAGFNYLLILAGVIALIIVTVFLINKNNKRAAAAK